MRAADSVRERTEAARTVVVAASVGSLVKLERHPRFFGAAGGRFLPPGVLQPGQSCVSGAVRGGMPQGRSAEAFLHRWSRRKREAAPPDEEPVGTTDIGGGGSEGARASEEAERLQALRDLWRAEPDLSRPDELDDFLEDFTEAARAVPAGLLTTAYAIGRGFWREEAAGEGTGGDASAEHDDSGSEPVAAVDHAGARGSDRDADPVA